MVARRDQDVGGLDVAVHEPAGVGGVERGTDLGDDVRRPQRIERRERTQIGPVDEPHREVQQPVLLTRLEHRQHVGMIDRRRQPRLGDEPLAEPRLTRALRRDELQRDRAPERFLDRLVDDAHPAASHLPQDAVPGDDRPDLDQRPPTPRAAAAAPTRAASAAKASSIRGIVPAVARSSSALSSSPRTAIRPRRNGGWAIERERFSIDVTVRAIAGSSGQRLGDRVRRLLPRRREDRRVLACRDHRRRQEEVVGDPDRHAVRPQLDPHRPAEPFDARLRGRVRAQARRREHRGSRGDQQDVAAPREHVRHRRAGGAPDAQEVDVDRLLDGLGRDHPQRPAGGDPRVGDGDVDPAESPREVVDRGGQRLGVAHVGDRGLRAGDDAVEAIGVDVDQPEAHAAGRELARELGADARRAAGDERHAPVQVPGHRHATLNGRVRFAQMSLPGDENPNPQWQRPQGSQWQSGSPLGGDADEQQPQRAAAGSTRRRNGSSRARSRTRAGSPRRAPPARPTRR